MRINGGRVGKRALATVTSSSGLWSLTENQQNIGDSSTWQKQLITSGAVVYLDAGQSSSYPGTGTIWYDLSGNSNNFNIVAGAWVSLGSKSYMNFCGYYGCAKNASDITLSGNVTYLVVTRPLNASGDWRTLTRSYVNDHHVIIQSGGWGIGMYDNDGAGFVNSSYSQQSLPGYSTNDFNIMCWRFTDSDNPTYDLNVNGTQRTTITNSNARYNRGFGSLGAYHNGSTTPSSAVQYWGDIAIFVAYNRRLSDVEVTENYNALRQRFDI